MDIPEDEEQLYEPSLSEDEAMKLATRDFEAAEQRQQGYNFGYPYAIEPEERDAIIQVIAGARLAANRATIRAMERTHEPKARLTLRYDDPGYGR
jgi:hypothetical protein